MDVPRDSPTRRRGTFVSTTAIARMRGRKLLTSVARNPLALPVLLVSTLVAYVSASTLLEEMRTRGAGSTRAESPTPDAPTNPFASVDGVHLIAFVITASDCGWSNHPQTKAALGSIRERMRSAYGDRYAHLEIVGVAIDEEPEAGLTFLSEIGGGTVRTAFDQVAVGGSWLNEQVVRFVWREGKAVASTPQVIVVERLVDTSSYLSESTIKTGDDLVVANPRGSRDLLRWLEQGLPLDYSANQDEGQLREGLAP